MAGGTIITFYSYKGGVGRTLALANVGVLLARWGYRVLCVDWDLEAPGLHLYFAPGLSEGTSRGLIDLVADPPEGTAPDWRSHVVRVALEQIEGELDLLPAGVFDGEYIQRMQCLDWQSLYAGGLGERLEELRAAWKEAYDFVLVDSRTGVTDIGGVCTVQMPDVLVLLFTANEQSLEGVLEVARRAAESRERLPFDRAGVPCVPVPSRFEGRVEHELKQEWLQRFADRLEPLYRGWTAADLDPRALLDVLRIPYVPVWSFGERLPVVDEGTRDFESLGYALETLTALLAHGLADTDLLLANRDEYVNTARRLGPEPRVDSELERLREELQRERQRSAALEAALRSDEAPKPPIRGPKSDRSTALVNAVVTPLDPDLLWRSLGESNPPQTLLRATERYLSLLVERYRYLDFRGMGVSDRVPLRIPLLEMVVPSKARQEAPEGETWARNLRLAGRAPGPEELEGMGRRLSEPRPVFELLRSHAGLVLLGDPGSGKTTLLKYLALAFATGQGEELGLGPRLPVLLPLSAYANELSVGKGDLPLDAFFARYYQGLGVDLPLATMFARGLERGGVLLLLDGLDEVREPAQRRQVAEKVRELYARHRAAGNKFVLTSRIIGYPEVRPEVEGLFEATLVDFDDEEVADFVARWTASVERAAGSSARAEVESDELLHAIHANPGVRSLAANPLLLTILALMKRQGVTLPERRVELYKTYVDTLLRSWSLVRSLAGRSGADLDLVETTKILAPLALWMHEVSPGVGLVEEGELDGKLEEIYRGRGHEDPAGAARRFLADVRDSSGLLLDRGGRRYGFVHLTFQEYLAAVALAQRIEQGIEAIVEALAAHVGEAPWHEVTLLTVGYVGIVQRLEATAGAMLEGLLVRAPGPPGEAAVLVGRALAEIGPGAAPAAVREKGVAALLATMRDSGVEAARRAAAGRALAELGDPRPEVMSVDWMEFCQVPAGSFEMGSDAGRDGERPAHEVNLPYSYAIGRYPVTVAQFREFVAAFGREPGNPDSLRGAANEPVRRVTWDEALAFCSWLTGRWRRSGRLPAGVKVCLPSEAEWEKAARGMDGRTYPWGEEADANWANVGETQLRDASAVGCFPGGASPYGCEEMSGNVYEWTRSRWVPYSYIPGGDQELDMSPEDPRVLRGGVFFRGAVFARCASRDRNVPLIWLDDGLGFRIVLSPFSSER